MRICSLLLLAIPCTLTGAGGTDAAKELQRLQGDWSMTALEVDGQAVPAEKLRGTTLTIKGDKYIVATKKNKHTVTIQLDPAKQPRHIDMAFADGPNLPKIGKGIYKLEGETLIIVRAQPTEGERPTQFGTWPNTGCFMVTWQRKVP